MRSSVWAQHPTLLLHVYANLTLILFLHPSLIGPSLLTVTFHGILSHSFYHSNISFYFIILYLKVLVSEFSLGVAPATLYLDNDALEDTYYRTAGIKRSKKENEVEKGGDEGMNKEKDKEKEKDDGSEDGSSTTAGQYPYLNIYHYLLLTRYFSSIMSCPLIILLLSTSPLPLPPPMPPILPVPFSMHHVWSVSWYVL